MMNVENLIEMMKLKYYHTIFIRVKINNKSNKYVVLLLPKKLWVFNPSPVKRGYLPVDVAVMRIQPTKFITTFLFCKREVGYGYGA